MSKRVFDLMTARPELEVSHLWMGGAVGLQDVGQKSPAKMLEFLRFLMILAWRFLIGKRYAIAYVTLAPWSHAAIRDGLLIGMSKLLARRTLVHLHAEGLDAVMAGRSLPKRALRWLIGGTEMIAITQETAAAVSSTGHFKCVHVLPNCVADPGEPAVGTSPALRCGYLANLDPRKGVIRFLECIEALRGAGLPAVGRIAGPSTATLSIADLEAQVQARGLSDVVEILGPLYGRDKLAFLSTLDVFIYLSRRDYFPLVVIEAMACGVAPVVYDNEGERELVGEPFAANVIMPEGPLEETQRAMVAIARGYLENPASLAHAKHAARARYLECYTEDKFSDRLNAIVDA